VFWGEVQCGPGGTVAADSTTATETQGAVTDRQGSGCDVHCIVRAVIKGGSAIEETVNTGGEKCGARRVVLPCHGWPARERNSTTILGYEPRPQQHCLVVRRQGGSSRTECAAVDHAKIMKKNR